jgi:ATP-dependent Clp protease ATP-binding subunit ClpC
MRRAISRLVEDHLAEAILSGTLKDGDTVVFDIDKEGEIVVLPEREPALIGAKPH